MFCYISPYNKTDPKKNQVVKIPDISFEFISDLQLDTERLTRFTARLYVISA